MINTSWYEITAVVFGIASVWFSKKENILVFPVGLVNTLLYIYLSIEGHLLGEALVNGYYSVLSIYGWIIWQKKDPLKQHRILHISRSTKKEWGYQLLFFSAFYAVLYLGLFYLKKQFVPGALPFADAFASAAAFTGMWLMTRKKVESWYWWIITNIASIPLYYVKGYLFTSFYYVVLLLLAVSGLMEWNKKARQQA